MEARMGLNIKNENVHRLAKQLAQETGQSMTTVIEQALEEKLVRLSRHQERAARLRRINEILARLPPVPPGVTSDHSDLYDDDGLPA
jgi:antitoxin VapB